MKVNTKKDILQAIDGSIDKWKAIVYQDAIDEGVKDCPLCALFMEEKCEGCPISKFTGLPWCRNTPHDDIPPGVSGLLVENNRMLSFLYEIRTLNIR